MMKFTPFGHDGIQSGDLRRKSLLLISVFALLTTACSTTAPYPSPYPQGPVEQGPAEPDPVPDFDPDTPETSVPEEEEEEFDEADRREGLTLPHMKGRETKRLALLLPFSASSSRLRQEAESMMKAAELAVFERDSADVLLIALDTGGTSQGAQSAAQAALNSGADVILGPILSGSVEAANNVARRSGTPVIAFSTDQEVAGNGAYLLSFPPEAEVERIVEFASDTGVDRFAFLGPTSEYGRRVNDAYRKAVQANGGQVTASASYSGDDISVMQEPARGMASQYRSTGYQAIILPEGGTALRSLAPLLPYYNVDPTAVQFLGTGLWKNGSTVREPALNGGVFAGPDPEAQAGFENSYDQAYGESNSRLASLAYDAVAIGAYVADGNRKDRMDRLEDPNGFYGADGLIRFEADGKPQRGLAVYQIRNGKFVVIDPAPRTVLGPS
ncbi:penicillin-binding protein activator [Litorimonas haliclonae]|uniref:penicillin-binding protein activator n=1 Tax=Litorimonas haliclonae TaxID=2081977 RepID=UPI0039EE605C